MEIGINLYCYADEKNLPLEKQAELMKQNGFTKTFCFPHEEAANENGANLLSRYGISFDTLHAPFDNINDIWKNEECGDIMLKRLLDSIDKCKIVGAPVMIVHLSSKTPAPRVSDAGFSRFDRLLEYAHHNGIKTAFENQRVISNISCILENYENAGFCWDVGHEECFAFGRRYMDIFGERLSALHIHDNRKEHNKDEHLIPFDGLIDYNRVALSITKYRYTGTLMLEVMRNNSDRYTNISPEDYYERAGKAAKKLKALTDSYRILVR